MLRNYRCGKYTAYTRSNTDLVNDISLSRKCKLSTESIQIHAAFDDSAGRNATSLSTDFRLYGLERRAGVVDRKWGGGGGLQTKINLTRLLISLQTLNNFYTW